MDHLSTMMTAGGCVCYTFVIAAVQVPVILEQRPSYYRIVEGTSKFCWVTVHVPAGSPLICHNLLGFSCCVLSFPGQRRIT